MKRCKDAGIDSVYDIMEMEDDKRNQVLQMDNRQMYVPKLPPEAFNLIGFAGAM